jgi:serine/threonine-protein kinase
MSHLSLSLPGGDLPGLSTPGGSDALGVPTAEDVVLLAVDLRRHARSPKDPERSVESFQSDLDRITSTAAAEGGRPEAILGHRVLVSFVGPKAALRALSVAVPLVDQARREGAEDWQLPTVAVASGPAALGVLQWGNGARRGLIGLPVARVDSLLRDASPGEIVLAASVRESLDDLMEERGLAAQARSGLVSSQRLYAVSPEELPRLNDLNTTARTLFLDDSEAASTPAPTATGPIHIMDTEDAAKVAAARAELPEEEAAVARLGPGALLGGRFEIVSILGTGGMGMVFKARDRELDEMIALKVLRREAMARDGHRDQLKEELKLARRITHPNVLRTYDFGELDGVNFVSMEYVRGVTLRVLLDRAADPLPFRAALRVVRQVSAGLAAAHEMGVIHRDMKPENVILDAAGNAKVMDFGIARTVTEPSAFTRAGEVVGTPHYLAPERLKNEPADARSDVYSLGVMLYEVFVGQQPFPGGTLPQIVTQHLHDEPPAPRAVREELPEELEASVLRCLAKTPEGRYRDAGALREALGRVQG